MADCAAPAVGAAPIAGPLQPFSRVKDYRVILQSCHGAGEERLAIRAMKVDGVDLLLTVDPKNLTTRLDKADCWTSCDITTHEAQDGSRFIQSVDKFAQEEGKARAGGMENAGLSRASDERGVFVTGDLCPSRKPLDRDFLKKLEQPGASTPVALSVSGLWILHHAEDFAWLRREKAEGRLAITFVNHSFHHPYRIGVAAGQNFLLTTGVDMQEEVLDVERLLIANGETPSVFFRFPGLISDPALMEILRKDHLIALGANAWLALSQKASPGAVVLVHPNGNEPFGLKQFAIQRDQFELPWRPITEAP